MTKITLEEAKKRLSKPMFRCPDCISLLKEVDRCFVCLAHYEENQQLLEAARIVERERNIKILKNFEQSLWNDLDNLLLRNPSNIHLKMDRILTKKYEEAKQKILSPNPDVV